MSAAAVKEQVRTYSGFRRERIGAVAGLPMGTLMVMVLLALPGVFGFAQQRYVLGVVWMLAWAVGVALVAVPVRGRSAWTWLWQSVAWLVGRASGASSWVSRVSEGDVTSKDVDQVDLPGSLQHVELVDGPPLPVMGLRQPCLIHDKRDGGSWRMVARLDHPGISMASSERLDGQAAALGDLMASLAVSGVVRRLSIYTRSEPGDDVERQAWLAGHVSDQVPEVMRQSLHSLEAQVRASSITTDLFVVVEVGESSIRREARAAGGGVEGRARVIYRHLGEVTQGLVGAGVKTVSWLSTPELVEAIHSGYQPAVRDELARARLAARTQLGVETSIAPIAAGPARAEGDRSVYRHGNYVTKAFTVVPPKQGTQVGSLAPLVTPAGSGERRSLAIHYETKAPAAAQRQVEREVNESTLAKETRARMGLRVRVRDRRQADEVARQEQVISAGHTLTRMAMVSAVTVPATMDIRDHAAAMQASARNRQFSLYPLDLAQDAGFVAAVLPVGIGLPRRKDVF